MNCLKNVVIWYEDHKHRCPYEPHLAELDPTFGLYTTAVWQCEAGHRYFQDLHSPLKPLSESDPDSDKGGSEGRGLHGSSGAAWPGTPCPRGLIGARRLALAGPGMAPRPRRLACHLPSPSGAERQWPPFPRGTAVTAWPTCA